MKSVDDQAIFEVARKIGSPEARQAYLAQICRDDAAAVERIKALLQAHDESASFLECPPPGMDPTLTVGQPVPEGPGAIVGPYKLLQQIGEGGMGTVYMAEQTQPVQRKVALKLIKPGMDSRQIIARFESERQALAMMDHVNIARVLDAGATLQGRPYVVMELVHGVPITKYCDDNRLTLRQRLELFVPVCQAIQHAHQKGIIHRDIKPSNVMVTLYDGKPVPKVIDFGVAKAIAQKLTERTLFTQYGMMVGTLEYMSPEQAEMSALGVDTRSDIYSLGVLLYELLTGSTPLTHKRMKEAVYTEILRMLKEDEPPKPSTRLSESGNSLPSISAQRNTEPAKLTKLVRGELDWIVMKCLEKDRNRRYETANSFATDVQRYLADEPVQAGPPSAGYRFRKFARRNRVGVAFAAIGLAFFVLVGGGLGWYFSERASLRAAATQHVQEALAESDSLFRNRKLPEAIAAAQAAEGLLHFSADEAVRQRVADWLGELNFASRLDEARLLAAGINEQSRADYESTAREYAMIFQDVGIAVEGPEAVERIRKSPIRDHLIAAIDHWANLPTSKEPLKGKLTALAAASDDDPWRSQVRLAARQNATTLKRLASEAEIARQAPSSLILLATNLTGLGEKDAAVNFLQSAQRRYHSDFWINQELAWTMLLVAPSRLDDGIRFQTAAVALRPQSPAAHLRLAHMLSRKGSLDEAMNCYQEAIRRKPEYSHAHFNLGRFLMFPVQDYPGAVAAFSRGLEFEPDNASGLTGRVGAYLYLGEHDKALADSTRAVALEPARQNAWFLHGDALSANGRLEGAVTAYSRAIELQPDYVAAYRRRGQAYARLGKNALAAADNAAVETKEAVLRETSAGPPAQSRAFAEQQAERDAMAIAEYTRLIDRVPDSPAFWQARGFAYQQTGQWEQAVADYSRAIELKYPGALVWARRADALMKLNRVHEAIDDLNKALEMQPDLPGARRLRGTAHAAANHFEMAVADFEKACQVDPGDLNSRQDCARAFRVLNLFDRAIAEYSKLMELSPRASYYPLERGQTYHMLGQYEKAIVDFTASIQVEPKSSSAYAERGLCHAELGQWKEAAPDYLAAAQLDSPNYSCWYFAAACFLGAADTTSYESACLTMLDRFRATKDPEAAHRIASACVLGQLGNAEAELVVDLADLAASENSDWTIGLRGAALYRAGKFPEALTCFENKAKQHAPRAWDLLFTSLTHHRLGNVEKAKELRSQAVGWMAAAGKFQPRQEHTTDAGWESWQEELEAQLLLAEAVSAK